MTKELRLYKLGKLAEVSDYVVKYDHYELHWPPPKKKQYACIDHETGNVESFIRVDGGFADRVPSVANYITMIDRRINYLFELVTKDIKEAVGDNTNPLPR